MISKNEGCDCGNQPHDLGNVEINVQTACAGTSPSAELAAPQPGCGTPRNPGSLIDEKVTLLIAASAAIAANCEPCLRKIVAGLNEAGVGAADIRQAVKIGQFVKDKPAANMKRLADELAGTRLAPSASAAASCPLDVGVLTATCGQS